MSKDQSQQDNAKQSEYDRLRSEIAAHNVSLSKMKKQRDFLISKDDYANLGGIITGITQLEKEKGELEIRRQRLNGTESESPQSLGDNQTVISTSSVRRKDSIALKEIERPKAVKQ